MVGSGGFEGKRVLIIEDRYLLADDIGRMVRSFGAEVVGPVSTVEQAVETVERERVDAALLDIDLRGSPAFAVADRLSERGVPYAFSTGYEPSSLPLRFRGSPFIGKPISANRLRQTLCELLKLEHKLA